MQLFNHPAQLSNYRYFLKELGVETTEEVMDQSSVPHPVSC